jgi:hypothetical protein
MLPEAVTLTPDRIQHRFVATMRPPEPIQILLLELTLTIPVHNLATALEHKHNLRHHVPTPQAQVMVEEDLQVAEVASEVADPQEAAEDKTITPMLFIYIA